jgi:hypothetical protein
MFLCTLVGTHKGSCHSLVMSRYGCRTYALILAEVFRCTSEGRIDRLVFWMVCSWPLLVRLG